MPSFVWPSRHNSVSISALGLLGVGDSSLMSQARRWGWRDSNPAEWAEPPPIVHAVPVVPSPAEVLQLIEATSGVRRGNLLRCPRPVPGGARSADCAGLTSTRKPERS